MPEIVYVLTNPAMPNLVKIGRTKDLEERIKQLNTTGVPFSFECFYAAEVADADKVEKAIHEAFGDVRANKAREFFRISPDKPKAIIELLCLRNVTPRETPQEPGEQEAVVEAKRRRSAFSFAQVGLKPGTVLQSVFDDTISCTVANEKWVQFRGTEESLSGSALQIAHEKGLDWGAIAGPDYWKYEGKTLSELREEKSSGSDG